MPLGPMRTKAQKQAGMHTVMHEFKVGKLRSGSKKGPVVKSRAQAIAIGLKQTHQSKYQMGGTIPSPRSDPRRVVVTEETGGIPGAVRRMGLPINENAHQIIQRYRAMNPESGYQD